MHFIVLQYKYYIATTLTIFYTVSLVMPKLLYLLRTADCSGNQLLEYLTARWLRACLSKVLNVDLNDDQWLQASLPVGEGELGIRSAQMLPPPATLHITLVR